MAWRIARRFPQPPVPPAALHPGLGADAAAPGRRADAADRAAGTGGATGAGAETCQEGRPVAWTEMEMMEVSKWDIRYHGCIMGINIYLHHS